MEQVQIIFHYFLRAISIKDILKHLPADKKSISKVYGETRTLIYQYMEDLKRNMQLGAENFAGMENGVVEIDETLMTHHNDEQMWVLGIFDRVTKELWCFCLPDRTAETIIPIIREHVKLGCRIYTDGWASYNSLTHEGYDHIVVPHVNGFGSGENTTNGIESCWSELKRLTNYYQGIQVTGEDPLESLQKHVNVGCWRRLNKNEDLLEALIHIIKIYYA